MPLWVPILFTILNIVSLAIFALVEKHVRHVLKWQVMLVGEENKKLVLPLSFIFIRVVYFLFIVSFFIFSYILLYQP